MIHKVEYKYSFPSEDKCLDTALPEYAFIGRSNVGKSSLINMLTQHDIAKVSGKPGKTQMINYFSVNDDAWQLVDLPGYGYAKVSKKHRASFSKMISNFLILRQQLVVTFILLDGGVPPQQIDLEFIDWMGENQLPFALVFTKLDKKKYQRQGTQVQAIKDKLLESWETLPPCFETSATTGMGREGILKLIEETNQQLMNR